MDREKPGLMANNPCWENALMRNSHHSFMKNEVIHAACAHGEPFSEWFFTCDLSCSNSVEDVSESYEMLAERLVHHGITPIYEKAFGYISELPLLSSCRQAVYRKRGFSDDCIPFSYIQGAPAVSGARFAGLQVYGIQVHEPAKVTITDIKRRDRCSGKVIDSDVVRQAFVMGLTGRKKGNAHPFDVKAEIESLFIDLNSLLSNAGFELADLVRTWIYMKRILSVYDDFNAVRTDSFAGLGTNFSDVRLPASTGIQGESTTGREISLDAIAIRATDKGPKIRVMTSTKQPEAKTYGSFFSRGMEIAWPRYKILHISGTASIDGTGRSVHTGDPDLQIMNTLDNVVSLLNKYDATMNNVVHACAFFKRQDLAPIFDKILRENNWHEMPCLRLCGDICRGDLFFEMDCIAIVQ